MHQDKRKHSTQYVQNDYAKFSPFIAFDIIQNYVRSHIDSRKGKKKYTEKMERIVKCACYVCISQCLLYI